MNIIKADSMIMKKDYLIADDSMYKIVFTNAECGRSFNRATDIGVNNLNSLKEEFKVNDIIYLKQIHSDKVLEVNSENKYEVKDSEADALITNLKNTIIGVFTADCVPIILISKKDGVCAAIHSGWRGTYESITLKTVECMKKKYNVNPENIKAYIGPHIRKCCYEVSKDLREKFIEKKNYIKKDKLIFKNNLSMETCIESDLNKAGILESNINSIDLCTYCSSKIKLYSYRKSEGSYGRMFAFVYLK
ncbi:peptidoglycan editing factor PgeF [Clostridium sp. BJN0001]|uniref:peptidoglycan editing factor PgeF n=1 Tax=Clostridium sp. BJN0001 TaxID=2930219 RepID=UPI001FD56FDE|nr:peptidoglycan editing factor PgeF [Clostridium sp. BJN0001]